MMRKLNIAAIALIILFFGFWIQCGGSESGGGGGGDITDDDLAADDDDDDDETEDDPTYCERGVAYVYDCQLAFIVDGVNQSYSDALAECLALSEIEDAWICRINCAKGSGTCDFLFACLQNCPTPGT